MSDNVILENGKILKSVPDCYNPAGTQYFGNIC